MKGYVAKLPRLRSRLAATTTMLLVTGCGGATLEVDQPYCIHQGSNPGTYSLCTDITSIFIPQKNGDVVRFWPTGDTFFSKHGTLSGSTLSMEDYKFKLSNDEGNIKAKYAARQSG